MFVLLVEMHLKDENDKPQSDNDFGKFEFKMVKDQIAFLDLLSVLDLMLRI
jgi:hypothetical protein